MTKYRIIQYKNGLYSAEYREKFFDPWYSIWICAQHYNAAGKKSSYTSDFKKTEFIEVAREAVKEKQREDLQKSKKFKVIEVIDDSSCK